MSVFSRYFTKYKNQRDAAGLGGGRRTVFVVACMCVCNIIIVEGVSVCTSVLKVAIVGISPCVYPRAAAS
jgi:hypothetical protein